MTKFEFCQKIVSNLPPLRVNVYYTGAALGTQWTFKISNGAPDLMTRRVFATIDTWEMTAEEFDVEIVRVAGQIEHFCRKAGGFFEDELNPRAALESNQRDSEPFVYEGIGAFN